LPNFLEGINSKILLRITFLVIIEIVLIVSSFVPFDGSGLRGYAMGLALKKVLKWML